MFFKRVFTLFLCAAFAAPQSFAQMTKPATARDTKPAAAAQISPALQEKSVALLNALARDSEQFYLPENRVGARVLVANLLWERDEKQARALFQSAVTELNALIGQVAIDDSADAADGGGESRGDAEENYMTMLAAGELRNDLLIALAAHDPKAALDALQTLSRRKANGENFFTDDTLELSLAEQIAARDPKQAYEIAHRNLDKSLGVNLFSALENIYAQDAETGARLARDILAKIKSHDTKIVSSGDYMTNSMSANSGAMSNTTSIMPSGGFSNGGSISNTGGTVVIDTPFVVNVWEIQQFLQAVKKLNRKAVGDKRTPAALAETEIKDLIDVLAQKYIKQPNLTSYEVAQVMTDITKYSPAAAQAIRRKMAQSMSGDLDAQMRNQDLQSETEDLSAAEIAQIAEKKSAGDERDAFYKRAAEKALEEGDAVKAKEIYARVKKHEEYDYLNTQIEEALPRSLAELGDMKEVRRLLAKSKTPEERIEVLSTLAASVAQSGDRKTASALMNEARSQYSGRVRQRRNLTSVLQLAQGYAAVEPEQGFSLLEGNVSYFNDLIAAGILLNDFYEYGLIKSDEVKLDVVRAESYRNAPNGVRLIRKLATVDFDRTVALADRFARAETRFFARFRIAEALLDPKAEETEKLQQQSEDHGDY